MRCTHCNKEIKLVPSAQERAAKYGGSPSFYTAIFTIHSECQVAKRNQETNQLMRRLQNAEAIRNFDILE